GVRLPERGKYAVGMFFASKDPRARQQAMAVFAQIVEEEGQHLLGWREVPTNNASLGRAALEAEPSIWQCFIARGHDVVDEDDFERRLYVIRKRFEKAIHRVGIRDAESFYFPSLSCRTVVYKGMLTAKQLREYYPDLSDRRMTTALAMFHARFSTNTFPSWDLAHPYRMIAHNGEINTLRGNINWMTAREAQFSSRYFKDTNKIVPILDDKRSDTANLDMAFELLVRAGRSPAHAMMMLIPEAWENHESMSDTKKAFYQYHSCLMEPWDGPASVAFTDGKTIGAVLDRNGLRPSRYIVTKDDLVIMASEVGVLPIPEERILAKGRLQPGRMFLVSLEEGRIIDDTELKEGLARQHPYREWLDRYMVKLEELPAGEVPARLDPDALLRQQLAFGYTVEDLKYHLGPMARDGEEAVGSMGNDAPLAVLSDRPQPLYNYFKQLFAQVTNPPLDAIREELVTSVETLIGPEGNLLEPAPEDCHVIWAHLPFLSNEELAKLKNLRDGSLKVVTLSTLWPANDGPRALEEAMERLFREADRAIAEGAKILILSDRGVDAEHAPIPALLAVAGLHHHLVRTKQRTRVGLVVESGEPREVHHFALLIGYGASAVNPYLAIETVLRMREEGLLEKDLTEEQAVHNLLKAIKKGVVKVMSKMGISTIQSYRGAQIFEAIGLREEFVDKYFTKTVSRVGGIGIEEVAVETLAHHQRAFPQRSGGLESLPWGGQYQWRRDGEYHLFNPDTVFKLQHATRTGNYRIFKEYSKLVDDQSKRMCTLRGLFEIKSDRPPIPIEEVEPAEELFKRFVTGAMSFGALSAEAHETLAIAMNRIGAKSNSGEGGEDRRRYTPDPNGDSRRSAVKQVASGRFGV
ncbi:MAG: glutamate synthase-related protein, partial [Dehalococcoidia bacterium]|nr:glutamate synthase-related protein [Dehalococcoidia bacterium]